MSIHQSGEKFVKTSRWEHNRLHRQKLSFYLVTTEWILTSAYVRVYSMNQSLNVIAIRMYGHTKNKSMDQPGKVANSARGQLNREN